MGGLTKTNLNLKCLRVSREHHKDENGELNIDDPHLHIGIVLGENPNIRDFTHKFS